MKELKEAFLELNPWLNNEGVKFSIGSYSDGDIHVSYGSSDGLEFTDLEIPERFIVRKVWVGIRSIVLVCFEV